MGVAKLNCPIHSAECERPDGNVRVSNLDDFADANFARGVIDPKREEKSFEQKILNPPADRILGGVVTDLERLSRNLIGKIQHHALLILRKEGEGRDRFA